MSNKEIMISIIINKCNLKVVTCPELSDRKIEGGYASDLLSDVMANTKTGDIWVTLQGHPNIVAVAKLKELAGIIIVNNRVPEEETLNKARSENIIILTSDLPSFELIGKLYEIGISGKR
jgi:hypothetical protein